VFGREVREAFEVIEAYCELKGSQSAYSSTQGRIKVVHAQLTLPPFSTGTHFAHDFLFSARPAVHRQSGRVALCAITTQLSHYRFALHY
jgi:hypothetical protein